MINVNLAEDALVHCLQVSKVNSVLVDGDDKIRKRIEDMRERIEALGVKIVILAGEEKTITESRVEIQMVDESLRMKVREIDPIALFYTRYVLYHVTHRANISLIVTPVKRNNWIPKSGPFLPLPHRYNCFDPHKIFQQPSRPAR